MKTYSVIMKLFSFGHCIICFMLEIFFMFVIPNSSFISLIKQFLSVSPSSRVPVTDCQKAPSFLFLFISKYSIFWLGFVYTTPCTFIGNFLLSFLFLFILYWLLVCFLICFFVSFLVWCYNFFSEVLLWIFI